MRTTYSIQQSPVLGTPAELPSVQGVVSGKLAAARRLVARRLAAGRLVAGLRGGESGTAGRPVYRDSVPLPMHCVISPLNFAPFFGAPGPNQGRSRLRTRNIGQEPRLARPEGIVAANNPLTAYRTATRNRLSYVNFCLASTTLPSNPPVRTPCCLRPSTLIGQVSNRVSCKFPIRIIWEDGLMC